MGFEISIACLWGKQRKKHGRPAAWILERQKTGTGTRVRPTPQHTHLFLHLGQRAPLLCGNLGVGGSVREGGGFWLGSKVFLEEEEKGGRRAQRCRRRARGWEG